MRIYLLTLALCSSFLVACDESIESPEEVQEEWVEGQGIVEFEELLAGEILPEDERDLDGIEQEALDPFAEQEGDLTTIKRDKEEYVYFPTPKRNFHYKGNDLNQKSYLASHAKNAYNSPAFAKQNLRRAYSRTPDFYFIESTSTGAQAYVTYDGRIDSVIIAYRGTDGEWRDFAADADITRVRKAGLFGGAYVPRGFGTQYRSIKSRTDLAVSRLQEKYPTSVINVTGHSLGGALAMLYVADHPGTNFIDLVGLFAAPQTMRSERDFRTHVERNATFTHQVYDQSDPIGGLLGQWAASSDVSRFEIRVGHYVLHNGKRLDNVELRIRRRRQGKQFNYYGSAYHDMGYLQRMVYIADRYFN